MPKIIYDRSSGREFYDIVIDILNNITGVPWGFVKSRRTVQYVSSDVLPIKIVAYWRRPPPQTCATKPAEIEITNKSPKIYKSVVIYRQILTAELQIKLSRVLYNLRKYKYILDRMSRIIPCKDTIEIISLIAAADEQNAKYQFKSAEQVNPYIDECIKYGFG